MRRSKYDETLQLGMAHGSLISLGIVRSNGETSQREWLFLCECGGLYWSSGSNVVRGRTLSCGCYARQQAAARCKSRSSRQGLSTSPIYRVWYGMMRRCYNEQDGSYADYGGRGITVDQRWHEFENFRADTEHLWFAGSNIDRRENSLGYGPNNFRFVTPKMNQRNRRDNSLFTIGGVTKCISEWAEDYGLKQTLVRQRVVRDGMPIEKALTFHKGAR